MENGASETLKRWSAMWGLSRPDDAILTETVEHLRAQIPIFYAFFIVNFGVLCVSESLVQGFGPLLSAPLIIGLIALCRLPFLRRWGRAGTNPDAAWRSLVRVRFLVFAIAVGATLWGIALYRQTESNVSTNHSLTALLVFACSSLAGSNFLLKNFPSAPAIMNVVVGTVFGGFLLVKGDPTSLFVAANMLSLILLCTVLVLKQFQSFKRSIYQRHELVAASEANKRLAMTDELTGLGNRRSILAELRHLGSSGDAFAIALLDLDGFKAVNELHGHGMGDQVLSEVANRLRARNRPDSRISRLGGDEFAIVVTGEHAIGFDDQAAEILEALRRPIQIRDLSIRVSASVGVCKFLSGLPRSLDALDCADFALSSAKKSGKNKIKHFTVEDADAIRSAAQLEVALMNAEMMDEVRVRYQPIVDIRSGAMSGVEALARWHMPGRGDVSPGIFIPALERIHHIRKLTCAVISRVLLEAEALPDHLRISVNLSPQDLSAPDHIRGLLETLGRSRLHPSRFVFEVTETTLIGDFEPVQQSLRAVRDAGCRIAIDDFGSGFSSFTYVTSLRPDIVKLDRELIAPLARDALSVAPVKAAIQMAHDLGAEVVAEGVDQQRQLVELARLGCDHCQGFLFYRPMRIERLNDLRMFEVPMPLPRKLERRLSA